MKPAHRAAQNLEPAVGGGCGVSLLRMKADRHFGCRNMKIGAPN